MHAEDYRSPTPDSKTRAGFATIPCSVLDDETLTVHAKMVWVALSSFAGCRTITPSHATLAKITSSSEKTVRVALKALAERQLVEWKTETTARGKINVYRLLTPWSGGPVGDTAPPGGSGRSDRTGPVGATDEVDSREVEKELSLLSQPEDPVTAAFEEFWEAYPKTRRAGSKAVNLAKFRSVVKAKKVDPQVIVAGIKARVAWWEQQQTPDDYRKTSIPWLNQGCWEEEVVGLRAKVRPAADAYAFTENRPHREPTWLDEEDR